MHYFAAFRKKLFLGQVAAQVANPLRWLTYEYGMEWEEHHGMAMRAEREQERARRA